MYTEGNKGNEGVGQDSVLVLLAWLRCAGGHDDGAVRKRRIYLGLIVGVVLAGMLVLLFNREREPEYEGKKLSYWVDQVSWATHVDEPERYRRASEAISALGTNAIPHLLKWIRYEPPVWKSKSLVVMNKVFRLDLSDSRAARATSTMEAIGALAFHAKEAIPPLAVMANDTHAPATASRAIIALYRLGTAHVSANIALMTNHSEEIRVQGVMNLWGCGGGNNMDSAIPVLVRCLQDTNEDVVMLAGAALTQAATRDLVVTALIPSLQDRRPIVRIRAARILGSLNRKARSAVADLLRLLKDSDPEVRLVATNELRNIDPEALRKIQRDE
jgi:hypothetical protein